MRGSVFDEEHKLVSTQHKILHSFEIVETVGNYRFISGILDYWSKWVKIVKKSV